MYVFVSFIWNERPGKSIAPYPTMLSWVTSILANSFARTLTKAHLRCLEAVWTVVQE